MFVVTADSLDDWPGAQASRMDVSTVGQAMAEAARRVVHLAHGQVCYVVPVNPLVDENAHRTQVVVPFDPELGSELAGYLARAKRQLGSPDSYEVERVEVRGRRMAQRPPDSVAVAVAVPYDDLGSTWKASRRMLFGPDGPGEVPGVPLRLDWAHAQVPQVPVVFDDIAVTFQTAARSQRIPYVVFGAD